MDPIWQVKTIPSTQPIIHPSIYLLALFPAEMAMVTVKCGQSDL